MSRGRAVGTLRGIDKTGLSPREVLTLLDERLRLCGTPRRHSALQSALFSPTAGEVRIASAGMQGRFSSTREDARFCVFPECHQAFAQANYDEVGLQLEPGDTLLFCTDGLTEARNRRDVQFGVEGFAGDV